jgi:cytoskeletal protein RodZ
MDQFMNNSNTQNPSATNNQPTQSSHDKPVGPVIGLVVILVVILLGGIYFWMNRSGNPSDQGTSLLEDESVEASPEIQTQSASDDTASIEADLNAFDESDIDSVDAI